MTVRTIELISPANTPILGALLEDGSTCKATMTYDLQTSDISILFDHNGEASFLEKDGELVYLDHNGQEWGAPAVIEHSLFHGTI